MVKVTEIDQKVYLIRSGQNIMKKSLGRRKNEPQSIRCFKRLVD